MVDAGGRSRRHALAEEVGFGPYIPSLSLLTCSTSTERPSPGETIQSSAAVICGKRRGGLEDEIFGSLPSAKRSRVGPHDHKLGNVSSWLDLFIQQLNNASNCNDFLGCTSKFFQVFGTILPTTSEEIASLKEQVQHLLRENKFLKTAVVVLQHKRNLEHQEKEQHLKRIITQYQEQVNTFFQQLKTYLQRAQESNYIPTRFHPDIF